MARQTWEYLIEYDIIPARLAEVGAEGWELVGIASTNAYAGAGFYFKRPAATLRERVTLDHRRRFESAAVEAKGSEA